MLVKRKFVLTVCTGLVLFLAMTISSYAQEPSEVQLQTLKLAENLYMFQDSGGMGNVTALTGDDGVLMIDTKTEESVGMLLGEIAEICPEPLRFVIITHWHFDHVGGNETVRETGAAIIAHENVRKQMGVDHDMEVLGAEVPASPETAMPLMTYGKNVTFHMNGETVEVFHPGPGHTDGDSVIYFPSANVIHMGDLYFEGLYPYIGIYSGGSINDMIEVINEILLKIDGDTKVVPGHGPVTDKARLQEYVSMLTAIRDNVHRFMQEGMTLEEVVVAKPTLAFDEKWGGGFLPPDQFAGLVYMDLSPEMP